MDENLVENNNDTLIVLEGLEGNPPTELNVSQKIIAPHTEVIVVLWWALWFVALVVIVVKYIFIPLVRKVRGEKK